MSLYVPFLPSKPSLSISHLDPERQKCLGVCACFVDHAEITHSEVLVITAFDVVATEQLKPEPFRFTSHYQCTEV